jgi:hypothetical protein
VVQSSSELNQPWAVTSKHFTTMMFPKFRIFGLVEFAKWCSEAKDAEIFSASKSDEGTDFANIKYQLCREGAAKEATRQDGCHCFSAAIPMQLLLVLSIRLGTFSVFLWIVAPLAE